MANRAPFRISVDTTILFVFCVLLLIQIVVAPSSLKNTHKGTLSNESDEGRLYEDTEELEEIPPAFRNAAEYLKSKIKFVKDQSSESEEVLIFPQVCMHAFTLFQSEPSVHVFTNKNNDFMSMVKNFVG